MTAEDVIRLVTNKELPQKSTYLETWLSWYRGDVMGFHQHRIYNGTNELEVKRKSMGMAKQVCESWANLLMNERVQIVVPETAASQLDKIWNDNNFWLQTNEGIELSYALGLGAMVVNVDNILVGEVSKIQDYSKSYVSIEFIDRYKIQPITIKKQRITECAFTSENSDSTNIVVHVLQEGTYKIHNYVLDKKGMITETYVFDTKSDKPFFFIIRPNVTSNFKLSKSDKEIGISIFANSIDTLKAIDNKYDGFDNEFVLGRKRTFISAEMWNYKPVTNSTTGEVTKVRTFDPFDQAFYHLPTGDKGEPMIEDKSGELRHLAYIDSLNTELDILSMKCGLGETYYKFNGISTPTATQVMSENSNLYRSIKKQEILLENVLRGLVKTVIYASNTFTPVKIAEVADKDIKILFDDSIIEDKETEMARARLDVSSGIMSKAEYRTKFYGEDDDTARKYMYDNFLYDEITKYMSAVTQGVMTPEQFVELVYPLAVNKPELIEYITEFMTASPMEDMNPFYKGDETDTDSDTDTGEE